MTENKYRDGWFCFIGLMIPVRIKSGFDPEKMYNRKFATREDCIEFTTRYRQNLRKIENEKQL